MGLIFELLLDRPVGEVLFWEEGVLFWGVVLCLGGF